MPEPSPGKTGLDVAIEDVLKQMEALTADMKEYQAMSDSLAKLYKIKYETTSKPDRVSKDTLAIVAGNIMITLVIVLHENKHVISTKAFNFLTKLR